MSVQNQKSWGVGDYNCRLKGRFLSSNVVVLKCRWHGPWYYIMSHILRMQWRIKIELNYKYILRSHTCKKHFVVFISKIVIFNCLDNQGYDHVQAYLGLCQKKLYVKKKYVKKKYVKKSRAQFLHFVCFSHATSILGFTKLLK
jgi:hypothetical protein